MYVDLQRVVDHLIFLSQVFMYIPTHYYYYDYYFRTDELDGVYGVLCGLFLLTRLLFSLLFLKKIKKKKKEKEKGEISVSIYLWLFMTLFREAAGGEGKDRPD